MTQHTLRRGRAGVLRARPPNGRTPKRWGVNHDLSSDIRRASSSSRLIFPPLWVTMTSAFGSLCAHRLACVTALVGSGCQPKGSRRGSCRRGRGPSGSREAVPSPRGRGLRLALLDAGVVVGELHHLGCLGLLNGHKRRSGRAGRMKCHDSRDAASPAVSGAFSDIAPGGFEPPTSRL